MLVKVTSYMGKVLLKCGPGAVGSPNVCWTSFFSVAPWPCTQFGFNV